MKDNDVLVQPLRSRRKANKGNEDTLPVDPGWADFSQRLKHSFSVCRHTGATLTYNVSSDPKMHPFLLGIGEDGS